MDGGGWSGRAYFIFMGMGIFPVFTREDRAATPGGGPKLTQTREGSTHFLGVRPYGVVCIIAIEGDALSDTKAVPVRKHSVQRASP